MKENDEKLKKEFAFDQYGRYAIIRDIIGSNRQDEKIFRVLDIGGRGNLMKRFLPKDDVFYLDPYVDTKDDNYIEGDGCDISLNDNSYDWVVSADVFEHIPEEKREVFLSENLRVAKRGMILVAPFHSETTKQAEINANENFKILSGGRDHDWLKEHIDNGLPYENKIENFISKEKCDFQKLYNNDINLWQILIGIEFLASSNLGLEDIKEDLEKFNLFYNTEVYPCDLSNPLSYRKIYFIKKDKLLKNLTIDRKTISENLLLKIIRRGFSLINKIDFHKKNIIFNDRLLIDKYKSAANEEEEDLIHVRIYLKRKEREIMELNRLAHEKEQTIHQKDELIQEKENDLKFVKSSKFWKIRKLYLRIKHFRPKHAITLAKDGYSVFKEKDLKTFFWSLYKYAIHGRGYFRSKPHPEKPKTDYEIWIEENEIWDRNKIEKEINNLEYKPKISIVTPVYNVDPEWLDKCIESVRKQFYENWELCLHDDASTKKETVECLEKWEKKGDKRIKISYGKENRHISGASNEALKLATGEFVALLDNDDELSPDALYENVKLLNENPEVDFIYSDEDKIDTKENRSGPFFKPDWSPDLFHCVNYICHFSVLRKSVGDRIGWFRKGYEGAQDFDLFLRFLDKTKKIRHIPKILYHWRMLKSSTARDTKSKTYAHKAGRQALKDYVVRNNIKAEVIDGYGDTNHYLRYEVPENALVSIVIPFKDKVDYLKKCVDSVNEKTFYKKYELILISNNSGEKKTFDYMETLKGKENIKIFEHNIPFNFSALNNWAAEKAQGDYILFLNNDTEVISPVWLEDMLGHAARPEVGAVGAKLLFPDGRIQHVGVILGMGGLADHIFSEKFTNETYNNLANFTRNYLAVTAACLMVSKKKFLEVGGFDENFTVCGNDVDLCLKLYEKGYLNIYTPRAELYHYESLSRDKKPPQCDIDISLDRYAPYLNWNDPYYNKNLSLDTKDARIRISPEWRREFLDKKAVPEERVEEKYQKIKFNEQKNIISAVDLSKEEFEKHFRIVNSQEGHSSVKTINWLLPNYSHVLFGGIYTILRFAAYFQEKKGIKNRIVIFDNPSKENVKNKRKEAIEEFPVLEEAEFLTIEKANDLPPSDAVVSTFWPSCYISARFNETKKKFYFVQDYEPLFYSAGSMYAMAEATYRMGFRGIVNTPGLADFVRQQHKMNCKEFYPCVNGKVYHISEDDLQKKLRKKTLDVFIYGRPNHDRNAFELGLLTLIKLKEKFGDKVNIYSAGDNWEEEEFGVKGIIKNLGRLGKLEAVADLYRKCDIGLVFMFTKHPSYQPFEFMACGCATVTNYNSANGWFLKDGENAMVSEPEPSFFLDKISKLIEDRELREKIVRNGLKEIKKHNWDEECEKIYEYIQK